MKHTRKKEREKEKGQSLTIRQQLARIGRYSYRDVTTTSYFFLLVTSNITK
jgi:hypothetical protein